MKRKLSTICIVSMFLLTGLISISAIGINTSKLDQSTDIKSSDNDGYIYGHVYKNFKGYEGATIELREANMNVVDSTTTDSTGFYDFRDVYYHPIFGTCYLVYVYADVGEKGRTLWLNNNYPSRQIDFYFFRSREFNNPMQRQLVNPLILILLEKTPIFRILLNI